MDCDDPDHSPSDAKTQEFDVPSRMLALRAARKSGWRFDPRLGWHHVTCPACMVRINTPLVADPVALAGPILQTGPS
jgi:hypothetical protein